MERRMDEWRKDGWKKMNQEMNERMDEWKKSE